MAQVLSPFSSPPVSVSVPRRILIIVICGVIAIIDGFDMGSAAFVMPLIGAELGLGVHQYGPILSASLAGMALGGLLGGVLGGSATLMTFMLSGLAVGLVLCGLVTPLLTTARWLGSATASVEQALGHP